MTNLKTTSRRRLILKTCQIGDHDLRPEISMEMIERLKQNDVKTIFIISSDVVDPDAYLGLVSRCQREGFRVRNIHIKGPGNNNILNVKKVVEEIKNIFKDESCLVLSYGKSFVPLIIACYHVLNGKSPSKAIYQTSKIDNDFIKRQDEIAFIYNFKKFLNEIHKIDFDDYIFQPCIDSESLPMITEIIEFLKAEDLEEIDEKNLGAPLLC